MWSSASEKELSDKFCRQYGSLDCPLGRANEPRVNGQRLTQERQGYSTWPQPVHTNISLHSCPTTSRSFLYSTSPHRFNEACRRAHTISQMSPTLLRMTRIPTLTSISRNSTPSPPPALPFPRPRPEIANHKKSGGRAISPYGICG